MERFGAIESLLPSKTTSSIKDESTLPNSVFDYDAYDAKVFATPFSRSSKVSANQLISNQLINQSINQSNNQSGADDNAG